jgi:maltose/moltooligosaccharide transporter
MHLSDLRSYKVKFEYYASNLLLMKQKPLLSFWQIWNMSFGFLGIQFGWGLQMANMSAIYSYLGANASNIAILWLAAPVTGIIIQPIIGQASDRIWTRLGRRRPFILGGAILASIALILMPNSPSIWMAAGLLWVLDGTINASMQPFRALVADSLPEEQNSKGFAIQSLFIGLGGTIASAMPWMMTNWFGVSAEGAGKGHIPLSVTFSFYLGAVAFMGAVLWTVFTSKEYPPEVNDILEKKNKKFDWTLGLADIFALVFKLPKRMWELGLVQFFTWIGMFCLWVYFQPAIAKNIFHAEPGSKIMEAAGSWAGFCFAVYNAVCFGFSFILIWITKYISPKLIHSVCLIIGASGLIMVPFAGSQYHLIASMIAIGIAWSSILSMPYAMLTSSLPKDKIGVMMGMFNLFIVIPQIIASGCMGLILRFFLKNEPMNAIILGGICMAMAAIINYLIVSYIKTSGDVEIKAGSPGH